MYKAKDVYFTNNSNEQIPRMALLNWINRLLECNLTKVEQLCSGAAYCQLLDLLFRGCINLKKVNFMCNTEYAYIENWKLLQGTLKSLGVDHIIRVNFLCEARFQENYEFALWFHKFFKVNQKQKGNAEEEEELYDPEAARNGQKLGIGNPPRVAYKGKKRSKSEDKTLLRVSADCKSLFEKFIIEAKDKEIINIANDRGDCNLSEQIGAPRSKSEEFKTDYIKCTAVKEVIKCKAPKNELVGDGLQLQTVKNSYSSPGAVLKRSAELKTVKNSYISPGIAFKRASVYAAMKAERCLTESAKLDYSKGHNDAKFGVRSTFTDKSDPRITLDAGTLNEQAINLEFNKISHPITETETKKTETTKTETTETKSTVKPHVEVFDVSKNLSTMPRTGLSGIYSQSVAQQQKALCNKSDKQQKQPANVIKVLKTEDLQKDHNMHVVSVSPREKKELPIASNFASTTAQDQNHGVIVQSPGAQIDMISKETITNPVVLPTKKYANVKGSTTHWKPSQTRYKPEFPYTRGYTVMPKRRYFTTLTPKITEPKPDDNMKDGTIMLNTTQISDKQEISEVKHLKDNVMTSPSGSLNADKTDGGCVIGTNLTPKITEQKPDDNVKDATIMQNSTQIRDKLEKQYNYSPRGYTTIPKTVGGYVSTPLPPKVKKPKPDNVKEGKLMQNISQINDKLEVPELKHFGDNVSSTSGYVNVKTNQKSAQTCTETEVCNKKQDINESVGDIKPKRIPNSIEVLEQIDEQSCGDTSKNMPQNEVNVDKRTTDDTYAATKDVKLDVTAAANDHSKENDRSLIEKNTDIFLNGVCWYKRLLFGEKVVKNNPICEKKMEEILDILQNCVDVD